MSSAHERLVHFLDRRMRMSQIYQPVMLEALLTGGGRAPIRSIAAAILAHDESQIDYYSEIVKRRPGRVLGQHDIVRREADDDVLTDDLRHLSEGERDDLVARCREEVERFKNKRGLAIWEHRRPATGIIPGSVRYNTFKRAAGRCELCGVPHEERALDVDHIVPRSEGARMIPTTYRPCVGDAIRTRVPVMRPTFAASVRATRRESRGVRSASLAIDSWLPIVR